MFVKKSAEGKRAIMIIYVDDIILIGNNPEEIGKLKNILVEKFEVKNLGQLKYFLGIEVAWSQKGIAISQCKYNLDLLKKTGMLGCKPTDTLMDSTNKIEMEEGLLTNKGRYQRLISKLIYLSHTRPNIDFAISMVSRYKNRPTEKHMQAIFQILQYLKKSLERAL